MSAFVVDSQTPRYISADSSARRELINTGGGTLYYKTVNTVSSSSNDGSIASGSSLTAEKGYWVISASTSRLVVHDVDEGTPQAEFDAKFEGNTLREGSLANTAAAYGAKGDGTTEDTTALQNAINAISTAGGGTLLLASGKTYLTKTLTPKSGVTIMGYGATMKLKSTATLSMFDCAPSLGRGSVVAGFALKGITFAGTGSETAEQQVMLIAQASDVTIQDCTVTNWKTGCFYIADCQRVRVVRNSLRTVCTTSGSNAINLKSSSNGAEYPLTDLFISQNHVSACKTCPIDVVADNSASTTPFRAVIVGNDVEAIGTGWGIAMEASATATMQEVLIANNIARYTGSTAGTYGIAVSTASSSTKDPQMMRDISIIGNQVFSTTGGIYSNASRAVIADNRIDAAISGLVTLGPATIALTGNTTEGSAEIKEVAGSNSSFVQNGDPVSGSGIPAGAYLLTGAGTETWKISANATATASGVALTIRPSLTQVHISNNVVRLEKNPSAGCNLSNLAHSSFVNNRIKVEAGSTSGVYAANFFWCIHTTVRGNDIEYSPTHGAYFSIAHDMSVQDNKVYNCSESASGNYGFNFANATALCSNNHIVDDRAESLMAYGIVAATSTVNVNKTNIVTGYKTAKTSGTTTLEGV